MTTEPTPFPESTIGAYLAGELDAETAERVRAYFEATPEQRAYLAYLRASLRGELAGGPPDPRAARQRLFAQLGAPAQATVQSAVQPAVQPAATPLPPRRRLIAVPPSQSTTPPPLPPMVSSRLASDRN